MQDTIQLAVAGAIITKVLGAAIGLFVIGTLYHAVKGGK